MSSNRDKVVVTPPVSEIPIFHDLKTAIDRQWHRMRNQPLFRTTATGDDMWDAYLGAFPEGSDPVFRKRRGHDCSCCRQFIRAMGNVVIIQDGQLVSLWDVKGVAHPVYQMVAKAVGNLVKQHPIDNLFMTDQAKIGTDMNYAQQADGLAPWHHFHAEMPTGNTIKVVRRSADIGPALSESRSLRDVMMRGLNELTVEACSTVLELIEGNALYRGEEHRRSVVDFLRLKSEFLARMENEDLFVWSKVVDVPPSVARFRNTVIGSLVVDLSEGRSLESAVASFEAKVAGENYKRPTAIVTPRMVEAAKKTVEELGFTSALERRFATLADVSIVNVLFADRGVRRSMKPSAFDGLVSKVNNKPINFDGITDVTPDEFFTKVLPGSVTLEVMVENSHAPNFVSLIAPADPASPSMFMWDNRFSWSYAGDVADSIKERVKKAGGNVTGDLCCRLAWSNYDDLDLHMHEPHGSHIFYGSRSRTSPCGGALDVDANAGGGAPGFGTREPVENIFYASKQRMQEGEYVLSVHQYRRVETTNVGFEVEIDWCGDVRTMTYERGVKTGQIVEVATMRYSKARGIEYISSLPQSTASRKVWGIDTQTFHRVNVVSLSPNHWDGRGVGNRHYFFFLDGCQNDGSARGFYNEFLSPALAAHRKVFEILGAKMRAEESPNQLSGLGFSSTQRNHVIARVTGPVNRTVKITF